jgi:hypothetical protein
MEETLFLIGEELKSRRLFEALHQIGIDECYFQPHLDSLILRTIGLDLSDDTFNRYAQIMDKRALKIEPHRKSITKQALKAYRELTELKRRR